MTSPLLDEKACGNGRRLNTFNSSDQVWYFAYGSNMSSETFQSKRGIAPLDTAPVRVPGWTLTFDIYGLPYSEPAFLSISRINQVSSAGAQPAWMATSSPPVVHGTAYLVSRRDYVSIIGSEGGGSAYSELEVLAERVPDVREVEGVRRVETTLKVMTLVRAYGPTIPRLPSRRYKVRGSLSLFHSLHFHFPERIPLFRANNGRTPGHFGARCYGSPATGGVPNIRSTAAVLRGAQVRPAVDRRVSVFDSVDAGHEPGRAADKSHCECGWVRELSDLGPTDCAVDSPSHVVPSRLCTFEGLGQRRWIGSEFGAGCNGEGRSSPHMSVMHNDGVRTEAMKNYSTYKTEILQMFCVTITLSLFP